MPEKDKWEKRMEENMDFINHLKREKAKNDIRDTMMNFICDVYGLKEDDMLLRWEDLKGDFMRHIRSQFI